MEQNFNPYLGIPKKVKVKDFNYAQFLDAKKKVKKEGINYIVSENPQGENIVRYFYFQTNTLISYTTYTSIMRSKCCNLIHIDNKGTITLILLLKKIGNDLITSDINGFILFPK